MRESSANGVSQQIRRARQRQTIEAFSKYIFLNPYRSELIAYSKTWPWWTCHREYKPEFMQALDDPPAPPEEWLNEAILLENLIEQDTP